MKSQNTSTNVESTQSSVLRLHAAEGSGQDKVPLTEIRRRAFEIHIERGGIHGCDLEDWLQAERELREEHNKNNDVSPGKK